MYQLITQERVVLILVEDGTQCFSVLIIFSADCPSEFNFCVRTSDHPVNVTFEKHQFPISLLLELIICVYPPSHLDFEPELPSWRVCVTIVPPTPVPAYQN